MPKKSKKNNLQVHITLFCEEDLLKLENIAKLKGMKPNAFVRSLVYEKLSQ